MRPLLRLTMLVALLMAAATLTACAFAPSAAESSWPATGGQLPVFYYFGDPG